MTLPHMTKSVYVGDFETTVYAGQERTDVWASALVALGSEEVEIFHSIHDTFERMATIPGRPIIYYHNLKFDGAFWLDYLLCVRGFKLAGYGDEYTFTFYEEKEMKNNEVITAISNMGAWYRILIRYKNKTIELRDSLKLLPFSVRELGRSFGTKHRKLDMEYTGYRYPGCEITDEERRYIANDVLVVKEALEIMYEQGHNKLTIGACCLAEFKSVYREDYDLYFPNLYEQEIDAGMYGAPSVGEYIHKAYRGGWCYLVRGKEGVHHDGVTADVNSLYPSMMHSESGNVYPYGKGTMWHGNGIPGFLEMPDKYYYVRFTCRFHLRKNKLPCIQIKNDARYKATDQLETSDVYFPSDGLYHDRIKNLKGEIEIPHVTLTVSKTDWHLINEQYVLTDLVIHDGVWFDAQAGFFDRYISKYRKIKETSKGAVRTQAKLFLNNMYGQMARSTCSSFKLPIIQDGVIRYAPVEEYNKKPGYIAIGAAITSYARNFTIRAAQANYCGRDKPGFIYADTDSIHCDLPLEQIRGVTTHPTAFCCWKIESEWDVGQFTRQKTYIEHVVREDGEPCTPRYEVKCAGMPQKCKDLFISSMTGELDPERDYTNEEMEFLEKRRNLDDFKLGLCVPGKLMPKRLPGGIVLAETTYEMR